MASPSASLRFPTNKARCHRAHSIHPSGHRSQEGREEIVPTKVHIPRSGVSPKLTDADTVPAIQRDDRPATTSSRRPARPRRSRHIKAAEILALSAACGHPRKPYCARWRWPQQQPTPTPAPRPRAKKAAKPTAGKKKVIARAFQIIPN